jgi:hypothetical protein
MDRRK